MYVLEMNIKGAPILHGENDVRMLGEGRCSLYFHLLINDNDFELFRYAGEEIAERQHVEVKDDNVYIDDVCAGNKKDICDALYESVMNDPLWALYPNRSVMVSTLPEEMLNKNINNPDRQHRLMRLREVVDRCKDFKSIEEIISAGYIFLANDICFESCTPALHNMRK